MCSTDEDACGTPAGYAQCSHNRNILQKAGHESALQDADRGEPDEMADAENTAASAGSAAASKVNVRYSGLEPLASCSESRAGLQVPSERSRSRVLHPTRRHGSQVLYQLEQT